MRNVLVLGLLTLCVGCVTFAGPISGSADVCARFDKTDLIVFDTVVDLDYTISTVTLGVTAVFDLAEFDLLLFTGTGTLGTLEFRSMLAFDPDPQTAADVVWTNAAEIALGGATLFGLFVMDRHDTSDLPLWVVPEMGVGAALGITGAIGDVSVTATFTFNMAAILGLYIYWYGYDFVLSLDAYEACGEWFVTPAYKIIEPNCDLAWDGAVIAVDFPLACLELTALALLGRESAVSEVEFGVLMFWVRDIEIGIPWLSIADLAVSFTVDEKSVGLLWNLVLGDFACVTPYMSLDGSDSWRLEGITLNALLLEYTRNGVTVKAGEIFDDEWLYGSFIDGYVAEWGFTLEGGLAPADSWSVAEGCVYAFELGYDEFFGIWIDGDSCCGGAFDVGIINFFDTGQIGVLFDWAETVATFEIGVGTNVTVGLSISVKADGLQWFQICGEFRF